MASRKRTRLGELEDEADDSSAVAADSPGPPHQRKRVRLSTERTSTGSQAESSDDDNEEDETEADPTATQIQRNGTIREVYERMRDGGSEDEEDEETVEQATQRISRENRIYSNNRAAENGVLESVTLINFMCHAKLSVSFGPLINFIIGHNGSGKSAILTGIALCLGGKAAATNRGGKLADMIMSGQTDATIICKLKNRGDNAYRPDVFGDSIIIERHFNTKSTSGFRIKATNGKIISTKKGDVDEITDFYALQMDNPVNVLTQDMSRQFLQSSSNADKYRFFMKGVQLEQLDKDYTLVAESLDGCEHQLENVVEDCKIVKKKRDSAREKYKMFSKETSLREKVVQMRNQYAWSQVEEQEKLLKQIENDLVTATQRVEEREINVEAASTTFDRANERVEELRKARDELIQELGPLHEKATEADEKVQELKNEKQAIQMDQKEIDQNIRSAGRSIDKAKQDVATERARLESSNGGNMNAKMQEIEQKESERSNLQKQLEELPAKKNDLAHQKETLKRRNESNVEKFRSKGEELQQAEARLSSLQRAENQHMKGYVNNLPDILQAIQQESRFQEKPIGPLGLHIKLLKPKWSSLLEGWFGGVLNSFAVKNKSDQALLSEILRRYKCRYPVVIGRAVPIDARAHEPDNNFDTVLRVLEIDNDLVRNVLIINQMIEQVVLVDEKDQAYATAFQQNHANVKIVLCFQSRNSQAGLSLVKGAGTQKEDPVRPWAGFARMKTDSQTQIQMQTAVVNQLKLEKQELENGKQESQRELVRCDQALRKHDQDKQKTMVEKQRAEERIEELKQEMADASADSRLDYFKDQLTEAEAELELHKGQLRESTAAFNEANRKQTEAVKVHETCSVAVKDHEYKQNKANRKLAKQEEVRTRTLYLKNEALEGVKSAKDELETVEVEKADQEKQVEDFVQKASQISRRVRVPEGETSDALSKKLEKLGKEIHNFEQRMGGTREQIQTRFKEAAEVYRKAMKQKKELDDLHAALQTALIGRSERWKQFRSQISARARMQFMYLTSERGFEGNLVLDHRKRLLDLQVKPSPGEQRRRGDAGNTRGLSGGEKSFSTVCLLLSLWDAMGAPIRCLDEFDVFMDHVNREHSSRALITAARRSVGRQYIFITPQSMSHVDAQDDVRIIRLKDPERDPGRVQTTID